MRGKLSRKFRIRKLFQNAASRLSDKEILGNKKMPNYLACIWKNLYLCKVFQGKHMMFGLWCNGSTTGFGSVCLGSNPGSPTGIPVKRWFYGDFYFSSLSPTYGHKKRSTAVLQPLLTLNLIL